MIVDAPTRGAGAETTSATLDSRTGTPSGEAITVCATSAGVSACPSVWSTMR